MAVWGSERPQGNFSPARIVVIGQVTNDPISRSIVLKDLIFIGNDWEIKRIDLVKAIYVTIFIYLRDNFWKFYL